VGERPGMRGSKKGDRFLPFNPFRKYNKDAYFNN
jgi:hypothetical protein